MVVQAEAEKEAPPPPPPRDTPAGDMEPALAAQQAQQELGARLETLGAADTTAAAAAAAADGVGLGQGEQQRQQAEGEGGKKRRQGRRVVAS